MNWLYTLIGEGVVRIVLALDALHCAFANLTDEDES